MSTGDYNDSEERDQLLSQVPGLPEDSFLIDFGLLVPGRWNILATTVKHNVPCVLHRVCFQEVLLVEKLGVAGNEANSLYPLSISSKSKLDNLVLGLQLSIVINMFVSVNCNLT